MGSRYRVALLCSTGVAIEVERRPQTQDRETWMHAARQEVAAVSSGSSRRSTQRHHRKREGGDKQHRLDVRHYQPHAEIPRTGNRRPVAPRTTKPSMDTQKVKQRINFSFRRQIKSEMSKPCRKDRRATDGERRIGPKTIVAPVSQQATVNFLLNAIPIAVEFRDSRHPSAATANTTMMTKVSAFRSARPPNV